MKRFVILLLVILMTTSACTAELEQEIISRPSPFTAIRTEKGNMNLDWYTDGTYTVGTDLPAGEYYLQTIDNVLESESYFSISKIINGETVKIKDSQIHNFCYIELEETQVLKFVHAQMIFASQAPHIQKLDGYYPEGIYRIGVDIPFGEYYFINIENESSFFAIFNDYDNSDDLTTFEKAMVRSTVDPYSSYLLVDQGKYLFSIGAVFIPAEQAPFPKDKEGWYGEGVYKVGRDIPPGNYKATHYKYMVANDGRYSIYSDSRWEVDSIITMKSFKSSVTFNVEDGQYLSVDAAAFKKID